MKISDIDKNLALESKLDLPNAVWFNVKETPFRVHGLAKTDKGEPFCRMPPEVAKTVSAGVEWLSWHTAGGRIRFRTDSPYIVIKTEMETGQAMPHITWLGQFGFDLYSSDDSAYQYVGTYMPTEIREDGYESKTRYFTDRKMHTYTINMPLYNGVKEVYVGLDASAELDSPEPYAYEKPVLYYGSSITQGGCASRPGNAYQAMISRKLNVDFINLGFSGNGHGQQAICDYMAGLDPLVFVSDYDYNAPNPEHLEATHYNLYETFRKKHPLTPYVMVSKPDFSPDSEEDVRRLEIIKESYAKALSAGDKHVYFVDGSHIFDGEHRDSCTVDNCHPNDLGFFRMAEAIGAAVEQAIKEI